MKRAMVSLLSPMQYGAVSKVITPVLLLSFVNVLLTSVTLSVFNFLPSNSTPSPNILYQVRGEKLIFTHRGGDGHETHLKQDQLKYVY